MTTDMRRLTLPSGGFFDLPMPRDGGRFVPAPQLLGEGVTVSDVIVPVAIGLAVGGVAAFILYQALK